MGATHSALPANQDAMILAAMRLAYEVAFADQTQQSPKTRKEQVYTMRRPYLTARGTHMRLHTPAANDAVEKSKATLVTADENAAVAAGVRVAGLLGSGGYAL